jgi:glycosyltransferase involved in cell wall biosynthesis
MEPAGVQSFLMNLYRNIDRSKIQFDFLVHYKEPQFYDGEVEELGGRLYKCFVREDYNLIAYRKQLRHFFSQHREYSILHGHMETLSGIWMLEAARAGISTRIAHSHTAGFGSNFTIKKCVREIFRRQYARHATDIFACSKAAGDFMFQGRDYRLVPNSIDTSKFAFSRTIQDEVRTELGIPKNTFVVGNVGRFHPSKNHRFLLHVFKAMLALRENSLLVLIGDGEGRNAIESEISNLGIGDRVLLLGKRQDTYRLYQAFDSFVLPSYFEGFPLVGIEAQASGCPSFFSTGVSEETGITELASFIALDDGPDQWAERIACFQRPCSREDYSRSVAAAGYDVNNLAIAMTSFYMSRASELYDVYSNEVTA